MLKIYHNARCSKSRAALAYLLDQGYTPEVINYLETPLTLAQLKALIAKSNLSLRQNLRTTEEVYAELNLEQADDEQLYAAVVQHPLLLNRPIVETEKGVRLGRPLEAIDDIL